jgi:hypothetical protein
LLSIAASGGSTFIPLNSEPDLWFFPAGDPDGCLLSSAVSGICSNAFRDPLVFFFRNDTDQPIGEISISFHAIGGGGIGSLDMGFYSASPGNVAPSSAYAIAPNGGFLFSPLLQPGEVTELLWVTRLEGNLQPSGGQLLVINALNGQGQVATDVAALTAPANVPEPSTASLLVLGIYGLAVVRRARSITGSRRFDV